MDSGNMHSPWPTPNVAFSSQNDSIDFSVPAYATPDTYFGNTSVFYETTANAGASYPTPISLPNSAFLDAGSSPAQAQAPHPQGPEYVRSVHRPVQGLGIRMSHPQSPDEPAFAYTMPQEPSLQAPFNFQQHHEPRRGPSPRFKRGGTLRELIPREPVAPPTTGTNQGQQKRRKPKPNARKRAKDPIDENIEEYLEYYHRQGFSWKELVARVNTRFQKRFDTPCLQMRLSRRRKRRECWSEDDVQLLRQAHDRWEAGHPAGSQAHSKFKTIANYMNEWRASEVWVDWKCREKWYECAGFSPPEVDRQQSQEGQSARGPATSSQSREPRRGSRGRR